MKSASAIHRVFILAAVAAFPLRNLSAVEPSPAPAFTEDFEKTLVGKAPEGFLVLAGGFKVAEEKGNKFIELPGAPLDSFGALFGPNEKPGLSVSGRIFATKKGRKFPAFGLSLQGAGGHRLQVSAAKEKLEIFKGDLAQAGVDYKWKSGAWTRLRLQIRPGDGGKWIVEGKAWPDGEAEPAGWTISLELPEEPAKGRPALWGNPFSGTPIRFDDLAVAPAH